MGLVDPALPPLPAEARDALDAVHANAYAAASPGAPGQAPCCFIAPSPMTHEPLFAARLLADARLLSVAVVHDFIPHRLPARYLPGSVERLAYARALQFLGRFNLFTPVSRGTAAELKGLLGIAESAIVVTGASLDPLFEHASGAPPPPLRHLLVVGGADPRKNPEVVIRAHARSTTAQRAGIPLVIAGNYQAGDRQAFRELAAAAGGRPELVEVPGHVSEPVLLAFYRQAFAIVSASRDEGFSLPVVEGMAAGLPALVSDIPVHRELVADTGQRFPFDDADALRPLLDRAIADTGWRATALIRQQKVWPRFRAREVAQRFWDAVQQRLPTRPAAPAVRRGIRPRVAFLSPLPPDRTGVAEYTAATCAALGRLVDLHVFTETERSVVPGNAASVRPVTAVPHIASAFDRVVNVVGNSDFHLRIFEMLRRYGGACIAHVD